MTPTTQKIYSKINQEGTNLGDLRKIAKEIKKDHDIGMELWATEEFLSRQLAILVMDKNKFDQDFIDQLDQDIQQHEYDEQNHLADWLMANQLTKSKKIIKLIMSWQNSPSGIQRRIFWYYQARLRWTGQTPPNNTEELLISIKEKMANEEPEVQWAMNFTAAQIGIFDVEYRARCITLGEQIGLYKDEAVAKGCTPNYLPLFINIQVNKLNHK